MKRDMDLARQIMLELEQGPSFGEWVKIAPTGWSEQEVTYHVMLLAKAGLIEADDVSEFESTNWVANNLTMQGHDFLDAAKNETIWQKAKKYVQDRGGTVTFEVLKVVLAQAALKQVGL